MREGEREEEERGEIQKRKGKREGERRTLLLLLLDRWESGRKGGSQEVERKEGKEQRAMGKNSIRAGQTN